MPNQVQNGKAFEFAIANNYFNYLQSKGINVTLIHDAPYENAKQCYDMQSEIARDRFDRAASQTIETLIVLEPGLINQRNTRDILKMRIASDAEGIEGDVRDIIFSREFSTPRWEVGFSAKNNHEAVKHSRLSMSIDFGNVWLNHPCSQAYFTEIQPVFNMILDFKRNNPSMRWNEVPDLHDTVYLPVLMAFRRELLRLNDTFDDVPIMLLRYLIGRFPFYKIIKDDKNNLVIVKAFNLLGGLNKKVNGVVPRAKAEKIKLPTRIIEFEMKRNSKTTLMMVLDEGWQISFRIHSADGPLTKSLIFDIELIGNPPILFTQHLFNLE